MGFRGLYTAIVAALACAVGSAGMAAAAPAPLVLISLDGFRADYLDRGLTPNLSALAADGVRAKAMRPSFPSVTTPNHYTLLTGLYPDHHGVIDNVFRDPNIDGVFGGSSHGAGPQTRLEEDQRWWNGATPLWVTAERAGLKAGNAGWPTDGVVVHDTPFSLPFPRGQHLSPDQRVDLMLSWFDLPPAERPTFVAGYFGQVDQAGHTFGPDSAEVNEALKLVDGALGKLVAGLKARGLYDQTNVVIVSDHGMTAVSSERRLAVDDLVDMSKVTTTSYGAGIGVDPKPGQESAVADQLLGVKRDHVSCWRKADIPPALHYGKNPRVSQFYCAVDLGWTIATRQMQQLGDRLYPQGLKGNHGYDPAEPQMAALFVARGPAFRRGLVVETIDNVDVYPMLAAALALKAEPNDGDARVAQAVLAAR